MHEAFWNGLFDVRWEEAPLGPEAIRWSRGCESAAMPSGRGGIRSRPGR